MSGLLSNRKTLLMKSESDYGVDPTPTGMANAMLVRSLDVQPLTAETAARTLIRPFLGNSDLLIASRYSVATFEIELAGSGAAGRAPAFAPALKSCGFTEQINSIEISSLTLSGSTATAVTATAHGKVPGDVVVIAGATETEYNGVATILTAADDTHFTFAVTGTPDSPATGSPVVKVNTIYSPLSVGFVSSTLYYNVDGLFHKLTGCFGTWELALAAKEIPTLKFTMTGIYNAPSDADSPTPDFSLFQIPKVANTGNTPAFSLFGYQGILDSMSVNLANDVQYRTLIGAEEVQIVDRKPTGTFKLQAPLIADKDFFTIANNGETGAMSLTHGNVGGNKVQIDAPRISLGNPQYESDTGVEFLNTPFNISPDAGNDEMTLTFL